MRKAGAKLLLDEYPLIVLPTLARLIGLHEAILLQQIHYWLMKGSGEEHDGRRWIFNSARQWAEQMPFLSERQVRIAIEHLKTAGLLLTDKHNKRAYDRTLWYAIDYSALETLLAEEDSSVHQVNAKASRRNTGVTQSVTPILPTRHMDVTYTSDGCDLHVTPIPESTRDFTETTGTSTQSSLRSDYVERTEDATHSSLRSECVGPDGAAVEDQETLPFVDPIKPAKKNRKPQATLGEAVQYHFTVTRCRLNAEQIGAIDHIVTDIPKWKKTVDAWRLSGNSPKNVRGLLDWYTYGVPKYGNKPMPPASPGPPSAPTSIRTGFSDTDLEVMHELERAKATQTAEHRGRPPSPT